MKLLPQKVIFTPMFTEALFIIAKVWKQPQGLDEQIKVMNG